MAALLVVLAAIAYLVVVAYWSSAVTGPPRIRSAHPIVTQAKADRIKLGMSYAQVKAIIGPAGKPISRFRSGPLPPLTPGSADYPEYEWRNSDGSFLRVTFHHDQATAVETMWLQ